MSKENSIKRKKTNNIICGHTLKTHLKILKNIMEKRTREYTEFYKNKLAVMLTRELFTLDLVSLTQ